MTMSIQALAGVGAAILVAGAIFVWWDRGMAIILELGAAVAACF